jgi:hypothetical protein
MALRQNIGRVGRGGRTIAGIVLLLLVPLAFIGPKTPLAFWGLVGLFPLVAGISGHCFMLDLPGREFFRKKTTANR